MNVNETTKMSTGCSDPRGGGGGIIEDSLIVPKVAAGEYVLSWYVDYLRILPMCVHALSNPCC